MDQELASKMKAKMQSKLGGLGGAIIQAVDEPEKNGDNKILQVKSRMPVMKSTPPPMQSTTEYTTSVVTNEQPAFGDLALLGITEAELDEQCDDLFNDVPIKFVPRKNNKICEKIKFYIKELIITIPIVHIKSDLYLVGSERLNFK